VGGGLGRFIGSFVSPRADPKVAADSPDGQTPTCVWLGCLWSFWHSLPNEKKAKKHLDK
jgi:hypothetical protein